LLRLGGNERYAVIEMGMNAPGEIWRLSEIADPDVGIITNVAPAHLEGVGSIDGVAHAKGELFARMRTDGVVVVNADDPHVAGLGAGYPGRKIRFSAVRGVNGGGHGAAAGAPDVTATDVRTDAHGAPAFRLSVGDATA